MSKNKGFLARQGVVLGHLSSIFRFMTSKQVLSPDISHVIELAWDDQTSFEAILADTGLSQPQVIEIMRRHLKPSSFRMWRARVCGRQTKHAVRQGTRFKTVSED